MRKRDQHGNKITKDEHFTKMVRRVMNTPAWRSLSTTAQALYPWLRLEWKGPQANNNGKIKLSVRQAAERLGVSRDTASKAFHELQAKGFIVVTEMSHLGVHGKAKGTSYEMTELGMPTGQRPDGRHLYHAWKPGNDFPVQRAAVHNPRGNNRS